MNKNKLYKGQALLIVLLSMAVVLVVVLSILARSITDVSVSSQDENSLRAFSAAEAGVEQALIIGSSIGSTEIGDASYNVEVSAVAEGEKEFNYPSFLFSGESMTTWFVAHDENNNFVCSAEKPCFKGNNIKICWGKEGSALDSEQTPAIELSIFYTSSIGDYSTTTVARETIDPNFSRRLSNFFNEPDPETCEIGGENYQFKKTLAFSDLGIPANVYSQENGLQFMNIRSIYNTSEVNSIGISVEYPGNSTLPSQGNLIDSFGSSGNANRKIKVFEPYSKVPPIFESAIFSLNEVVKE